MKKRALVSVSDKTGIVELAKKLVEIGVEIISTGGTKKLLQENEVPVIGISDITGFPEILDGRVKTLHPNVHGGLLGRRDLPSHLEQMEKNQIEPIDFVIVNLYPFKETISKADVTLEDAIENIDIGGPSMLRSAAKNHKDVIVLVDSTDYEPVLNELQEKGSVSYETRIALAAKVFRHTSAYDALIAEYLTKQTGQEFPEKITMTYEKIQDLRYGENPHQNAAFYREALPDAGNISTARQLHGKELSYNNINDAHAALSILAEYSEPAVVAVKHTNPCGVGIAGSIYGAYQKAYEADPVSIFGGIVALNREVDEETANAMKDVFLEIIVAPKFSDKALSILTAKKNLRLLEIDIEASNDLRNPYTTLKVGGGLLVQKQDLKTIEATELKVVTKRQPTEEEIRQLLFAWKVVKHVKSNAIVLAKDNQTIGVGAGQMNRVGSAKIAIEQAGVNAKGSVLASDAFFPMADTVEAAAKAGITAIIQPGGSIRDEDSIKEADKHGITMVFTGVRHFKH
ncbi:bifunctional phosphoribosylaminoimidazolecarboxamide formyltransferase/IMP cyclohydrolase [Desulfuribacillus stibiiarsenatis]|uniref:Bifunctional purine biosynthesis protein PurH n=1 Tax=Desulfuribacillus stibiiarsenatis TaxID=1390249 RepID=A0A1E5L510_9FIRM|nr:bifunctional phosphoribosylaminoimidazolecarboxamide formyltransferase/IMP cyclohydrolase [Desulfuribacillus stibiiarsenatis]OEH85196.1 bifunctional phosphoribosylaminoimidazolecarboxamide formyltransferase/IMP cyclohydrolase [Desulfuribacillus stibiiarsenatis]